MNSEIFTRSQINRLLSEALYFIAVIVLSLLVSFRIFGTDNDYQSYVNFYNNISSSFVNESRFEPGFFFISYVTKEILGLPIFYLLFLVSFLSLYIKFKIIRINNHWLFFAFLYLISMALYHEFTQIRAAIALAFSFLALANKSEGKTLKASVLLVMAVLFHYSMLFIFVVFLLPESWLRKDLLANKKILLHSCIVVAIAYFSMNFFVSHIPILQLYYERADTESFNFISVRVLVLIPVLLFGLISYSEFNSFEKRCYLLSLIGMLVIPVTSFIPTLASRLFEMSIVSYFFWIPAVRRYRLFAYSLFSFLCLYLFIRNIYLYPIFH